jgi:RimJ/RimL family protein N-acetyltransferase
MLPTGYSLTLAGADDVRALTKHWSREVLDNGDDGLFFSPYEPDEDARPATPDRVESIARALVRPLDEPSWQRAWVLRSHALGPRVLGSLSLYGGRLPSELHRVGLGMGIEPEHRGRRIGSAMVETALEWARAQERLAWIDLGVFAMNARARALYKRFGFVEVSERRDAFRVRGVSITDVSMTLALRG